MTKRDTETVHTVTDDWDGPVSGIADFQGKPHHYERQFDEVADEYSNTYRLTPIDGETFALAMEAWEIWLRWEAAFHHGLVTLDTHPSLPPERARSDELKGLVDARLADTPRPSVTATGNFERIAVAGKWGPFHVRWSSSIPGVEE